MVVGKIMNIIISCFVYISGIILINILYTHQLNKFKEQLLIKDNQINTLNKAFKKIYNQNRFLNLELDMYKDRYYAKNYDYNNDIKDAVKYAMKYAHPDNGGSSEDSQKFRKLYESMK